MTYVRKPHKKAKTGCTSCKRRRIKCDETKPICLRCQKRELQCIYLPVPLKSNSRNLSSKDFNVHTPLNVSVYNDIQITNSNPGINDPEFKNHDLSHSQNQNHNHDRNHINKNSFATNDNINTSAKEKNLRSSNSPQSSVFSSTQSSTSSQVDSHDNANSCIKQIKSIHSIADAPVSTLDNISINHKSTFKPLIRTNVTGINGPIPNINALEPRIRCVDDKIDPLNNMHEQFCTEVVNKFKHARHSTQESETIYNSFTLPQTSFKKSGTNSADVKNFFDDVKHIQNQIIHSTRLPNHTIINNIDKYYNSMLISPIIDHSYLSNLHISQHLLSYACHSEFNMKILKFSLNNLPFFLTSDPFMVQVILIVHENSSLYDSLYHVFDALSLITLYHLSKNNNNKDDFLCLEPDVYLSLSDYHIQRSLQSLNVDVNMEETCRRTCCLYYTTYFQIFLSICLPTQKIASRSFLMLYKNMQFIEDTFQTFFFGCDIFKETIMRVRFRYYSDSLNIYYPEFLNDLVNCNYESESNDKLIVQSLTESNKSILNLMLEKLKINYRIYQNSISENGAEKDDKGNEIFENDLLVTVHRLFYRVPDEFIDLVAIGEPRSLIIVGYYILLLSSKQCKFLKKSHYRPEIDFILSKLDRVQNSQYWKAWLNPVVVALSDD